MVLEIPVKSIREKVDVQNYEGTKNIPHHTTLAFSHHLSIVIVVVDWRRRAV